MKQERLQPIRDREVYSNLVAQQIEFELYVRIFKPILDIFGLSLRDVKAGRKNAKELSNARSGLAESILSGRVTFFDGFFKGQFSAAISKELWAMGGMFYPKQKMWKIRFDKLPVQVTQAIARVNIETNNRVQRALGHLDKLEKEGMGNVDLGELTEKIIGDLQKQFVKTTAKTIEIPMAISGYIDNELKEKYTENLNLYIKGWSDESIVRLRGKIQENSERGFRAEGLQKDIINEYGVSRNKAKFLARQETSLLVSKYRESNYKEAGVNFYQWSSSHDTRVRSLHRKLNGQIFTWTSPPIIDERTGERGNPGEAFGCRCVAVPVLMSQMDRINEMAKSGRVFKGDLTNV